MDKQLTRSDVEISRLFQELRTFASLADLLEISSGRLNYILHSIPLEKRYKHFQIPKKAPNKFRDISAPIAAMSDIQYRLKEVFDIVFEPRCSNYGFIKGRNIVDNARAHLRNGNLKFVLNIDLEDFFPSIHFGRVRGLFHKRYRLPYEVADWIARICCFENGLPQGAPTSPVVSNMIANKMDSQIQRLAEKYRCTYTRYADDIAISTTLSRFPDVIAYREAGQVHIGFALQEIISDNSFRLNPAKTRLQATTQRQEITGLTVNKFANVRRKYIREVRAILHDWALNGEEAAARKHFEKRNKAVYPDKPEPSLRSIVRGKIEYIGMVRGKNDPIYLRYMRQLIELVPDIEMPEYDREAEISAKIFISYAREDEDQVRKIYQRLKAIGYQPWMDKKDIIPGQDWQTMINIAIEEATLVLFIASNHSVKKRGVLRSEVNQALDRVKHFLEDQIYFIPLRIEECEIHDSRMKKIQWLDYFAPNGWDQLTLAIQKAIRQRREDIED